MDAVDFVLWLRGYLGTSTSETITKSQLDYIKQKLNDVSCPFEDSDDFEFEVEEEFEITDFNDFFFKDSPIERGKSPFATDDY